MFRVKKWAKGHKANYFSKNDVHIFKGISLLSDTHYPSFMKEIICHYFAQDYRANPLRKVDNSPLDYPFQLDGVIIDGSRFFDTIRHYEDIYNTIRQKESEKSKAFEIIEFLNSYPNSKRKGDIYVRDLFDAALLYYIDRFGFVEIDKIAMKIFFWAYSVRLKGYSVGLASVENHAVFSDLFHTIREARNHNDVLNFPISPMNERELARNADERIKEIFKKHNKLIIKSENCNE